MTAELRRVNGRVWVVDPACGLEEPWGLDEIGASVRAEEHDDRVHGADDALERWTVDPSGRLRRPAGAAAR